MIRIKPKDVYIRCLPVMEDGYILEFEPMILERAHSGWLRFHAYYDASMCFSSRVVAR